jgi:hypothetical protein
MKILLLILTLVLPTQALFAAGECPSIAAHDEYNINQYLFDIGSDFNILSNKNPVGKIKQRTVKLRKTFKLYNENDQHVATAKEEIFSAGVKINIEDCNGQHIGTLDEALIKSFFKIGVIYSLLNEKGQLIGQSQALKFFETNITFYDSADRTQATLTRGMVNIMRDKWTLKINRVSPLDNRLLFFTAAYKTSADEDRRNEEEKKEEKEKNERKEKRKKDSDDD